MGKYKALMIDMDGTVLPTGSNTPSLKVIDAIKKAKSFVHISAVTGRLKPDALPIFHSLSLNAPCIITGGTQVIDPMTGEIVWNKTIPDREVTDICGLLYKSGIRTLILDTENIERVYKPGRHFRRTLLISIADVLLTNAEQIKNDLDLFKNIAINNVLSEQEGSVWVNITHIEATKQYGILKVSEMLGINTHEIIGVGDGYNDFPLLMACGLKIAMGNAVSEIKEIADYIAPSVYEDGLVDVIDRFILKDKSLIKPI